MTDQRILHPGTIVEYEAGIHTAIFTAEDFTPQADQEVLVYFDCGKGFMQQPARINVVMQDDEEVRIAFETTGEPVSAESRQCYRVSTLLSDLTATFQDEPECPLLEVSATGFAVLASEVYSIGTTVNTTLSFEDQQYTGKATVQGVKEINPGRIRYGLHCLSGRSGTNDLARGLQAISMTVQRRQLRRQLGAA
ncbi:MAG: hypothetical protein KAS72_15600 [Phycisphaerales bacterium]|nr:hypothetical protein [Phycisphaerales bacterium]